MGLEPPWKKNFPQKSFFIPLFLNNRYINRYFLHLKAVSHGGLHFRAIISHSESVFLDEGQGASGGVSYFANFLINLDQ